MDINILSTNLTDQSDGDLTVKFQVLHAFLYRNVTLSIQKRKLFYDVLPPTAS